MATADVRLATTRGGCFFAGFVTAVCCGGLPLFASIGAGAFFAGLRLWRFVPLFLAAGTASIVGLNWLYYRAKARAGGQTSALRRAMFVSAGVGLVFMVGAVVLFDWLEGVVDVEHYMEGANEEPHGTKSRGLLLALASFPAGMAALAVLPFPQGRTPGGSGAGRARPATPGAITESDGRTAMNTAEIKEVVRGRYGAFAETGGAQESCCAAMAEPASGYATELGLYSATELARVPKGAVSLSRGCGNPTGFAGLEAGQVVVDFGCGGGIDVILAAHQVGPAGRVIGVDMTPQMIEGARRNVVEAGVGDGNVELRVADLADTGLPAAGADVVISNCVINLCPDKDAVYREAFRILRPGGRLAISDVVATEELPAELAASFQSTWAGCVGGAVAEKLYFETVCQAGFDDVSVVSEHPLSPVELEEMVRCPGPQFTPPPAQGDLDVVQGKITSIKFTADKPG